MQMTTTDDIPVTKEKIPPPGLEILKFEFRFFQVAGPKQGPGRVKRAAGEL